MPAAIDRMLSISAIEERCLTIRREMRREPSDSVWCRRALCADSAATANDCASCRATQPDDRQLCLSVNVLDFDVESSAGISADECLRSGARRTARPTRPWFNPRLAVGWESLEVNLVRCRAPWGRSVPQRMGNVPVLSSLSRDHLLEAWLREPLLDGQVGKPTPRRRRPRSGRTTLPNRAAGCRELNA